MGFSVTVAHVIFLATALAAASAAGGILFSTEKEVAEKTREDWRQRDDRTWSNLTITNSTYDSGSQELQLNLTNEGSTVLDVTALEYVVDGEWQTDAVLSTSVEGDSSTELWLPGEELIVVLGSIPAPGEKVRVLAGNGASAYW